MFQGVKKETSGIKWVKQLLFTLTLRGKCPNTDFFLVHILLYSNWIRRFTLKISVFIQSEYRKIRIRKISVFGHFSRGGNVCKVWSNTKKYTKKPEEASTSVLYDLRRWSSTCSALLPFCMSLQKSLKFVQLLKKKIQNLNDHLLRYRVTQKALQLPLYFFFSIWSVFLDRLAIGFTYVFLDCCSRPVLRGFLHRTQ